MYPINDELGDKQDSSAKSSKDAQQNWHCKIVRDQMCYFNLDGIVGVIGYHGGRRDVHHAVRGNHGGGCHCKDRTFGLRWKSGRVGVVLAGEKDPKKNSWKGGKQGVNRI